MQLRQYLDILRRRWLTLAISAAAVIVVTGGVMVAMTPQYTATTQMFFAVQNGETNTDLAQGSSFTEKQMTSYATVATSPLVLNPVIDELGLGVDSSWLADHVSVRTQSNTVILEIAVTVSQADQAARIANAIGDQLGKTVAGLTPQTPDGSEAVRATILAPAVVPAEVSSPRIVRNLALAVVVGVLLGIGVALLKNLLDTKIREESDVRSATSRSVLGLIPYDPGATKHPVVMRQDPSGRRSEAVRRLRTNLQFIDVAEDTKSIVVTSSIPEEGKTTTAINLAISLADAGLKVILVDADLRRPSIADYLGLEGTVGLTTVLIGKAELDDVIQPWRQSSLALLPAGQIPPNPSELLGSSSMSTIMTELADRYDLILLDSPPLLPVTDAAVLGKRAGGVLVVVGADRIRRPQLINSLEALDKVGANVVGVVLNKISRRDSGPYVYEPSYSFDGAAQPASDQGPRRAQSKGQAAAAAAGVVESPRR